MKELNKGDDSRKNWPHINELKNQANSQAQELARLRILVAALQQSLGLNASERFPFRVHTKPNLLRDEGAEEPNWWRIFYVRHGYVNLVKTTGCEDTDAEGTTPVVITVPDLTAVYYVWLDVTFVAGTVSAAAVQHGSTPWTSYPAQAGLPTTYHALLAKIDTNTKSTEKTAIVRQFRVWDIFIDSVGSSAPTWI